MKQKTLLYKSPQSKEEVVDNLVHNFGTDVQYFFHSKESKEELIDDFVYMPAGEDPNDEYFMAYLLKQANLIKVMELGAENWKELEGYRYLDKAFLLERLRDGNIEHQAAPVGTKSYLVCRILEELKPKKRWWRKVTYHPTHFCFESYYALFPDRREEVENLCLRKLSVSFIRTGIP